MLARINTNGLHREEIKDFCKSFSLHSLYVPRLSNRDPPGIKKNTKDFLSS